MSAFADDEGRLLKCDGMAMPSKYCLFEDVLNENVLLKAWNTADKCGVLAVFNISKKSDVLNGEIKASDVDKLPNGRYVVYDRYNNKAVILDEDESYKIKLNNMDCGLYIFSPVTDGLSVIGIIDKYIPVKAIKNIINFDNRFICEAVTSGTFAYCCDGKHKILINNHEVQTKKADGYLYFDTDKRDIIEIIKQGEK